MLKKTLFPLTIFILLSANIFSQTVIGKYGGEFMAIGVGGRPLGMGGAFTAIANDVTAGYYNPAGLGFLQYPQISLMHDERFGNLINYNYGAVAVPYGKDLTFALSIMRLGIDGIYDTRSALYDANGDGILDINTDRLDYDKIKEFSNQDWAIYLSGAKRINEKLLVGANIKILRRVIGSDFSATGFGFDVGAIYSPFENLFLGATVQDVTTTLVAWNTGRNELITPTAKLGTAYALDLFGGRLTPAVDVDIRFENRKFASVANLGPVSFDPRLGVEYNYKEIFAIRAGYTDVKQITIGAGVKLPKLNIDYSFAKFNMSKDESLGDTHRISLILTLEEPKFLRASE